MSGTASVLNSSTFRTVKRTATRPRPIATVTTMVSAASGARLNVRMAYWRSPMVLSMNAVPRSSRHSSAATVTDPKRARAFMRASSGLMPSSISFRVSCSMWNCSSSLRSRSTRLVKQSARARNFRSRRVMPLRQFHDASDRVLHPVPVTRFDDELLPSQGRQPVIFRPPPELRHFPLGFDPAAMLEPVQGRVQRTLVDLEHVLGNVLDSLGDRPTMERIPLQRAEDQQIQRSGEQIWGARSH